MKSLPFRQGSRCLLLALLLLAVAAPGVAKETPSKPAADRANGSQQIPYETLANILQNDKSRQRLIRELRRLAARQQPGGAPAGAAPAKSTSAGKKGTAPSGEKQAWVSLPRHIAKSTGAFVENLGSGVGAVVARVKGVNKPSAPGPTIDMGKLKQAVSNLFWVIGATLVVFFALRAPARTLFSKIGGWADGGRRRPLLRRLLSVGGPLLIDIGVIGVSSAAGYALGLYVFGHSGKLETRQSLFLNAFVLVEIAKALVRMVFAPRHRELRLFRMPGAVAVYWNRWFNLVIGIIGYTWLVAVPIINFKISPALGSFVGFLVMLGVYVYAVFVILTNRKLLRARLATKAANASMAFTGVLMRILGRIWHYVAIAYFTGWLILSEVRPEQALPFMTQATLQTLIAVGIGLLAASLLTRLIGRRISLGETYRRRMPSLEKRLNAYVPNTIKAVRLVILVAVALEVLDAWGLFHLGVWLGSSAGVRAIAILTHVVIVLAVAALVWIVLASLLEHRLSPETGRGEPSAREKTLLALLRNVLIITLVTMTSMIVLSQIGVNIGPLIAGAGVLGLGIGFGSQKLVQDVITGLFIQIENAMNTGDIVTASSVTGTVERITIRSVSIRDLSGTFHIVPFSAVNIVSNYMRGFANHVGQYEIAYREDIDEAIEHLQAAFEELRQGEHKANILEPMTVPGVTSLADGAVSIRIMIKTAPGSQWAVGRAFNRLVKQHFDAAGIEIPLPHRMLYFGEDKAGNASPLHARLVDASRIPDVADGAGVSDEDSTASGQTGKGASAQTRADAKKPDND